MPDWTCSGIVVIEWPADTAAAAVAAAVRLVGVKVVVTVAASSNSSAENKDNLKFVNQKWILNSDRDLPALANII